MSRIIDISPLFSSRMAVFPGDTAFERRELMHVEKGNHISLSAITTTVHAGSHADAPVHYGKGGRTIDRQPLDPAALTVRLNDHHRRSREIVVETALQRQFHDCGTDEAGPLILQRNIDKTAVFVLEGEQEELLRNCQHGNGPVAKCKISGLRRGAHHIQFSGQAKSSFVAAWRSLPV
jgi:hypothetical protein